MAEWSRYEQDDDDVCLFCFMELTSRDFDARKCPRCSEPVKRKRLTRK